MCQNALPHRAKFASRKAPAPLPEKPLPSVPRPQHTTPPRTAPPAPTMSIQMSFIFLCLVVEMVLVALLVLPLPFNVRKLVVHVSDLLINSTHYRVIIGFLAFMVGLMFVDSAKRSTISYNAGRQGGIAGRYRDDGPVFLNPFEKASRSYNQRNMYITGAVLYLGLCVPTIVSILKKLIKHKNKYDAAVKRTQSPDDTEAVEALMKQLSAKENDVQTLKKQIKNLQAAYDKAADSAKSGVAAPADKKND